MYKYLGGGFLLGVPARNLTAEEAEVYGTKRLVESGLYVKEEKDDYRKKSGSQKPRPSSDKSQSPGKENK